MGYLLYVNDEPAGPFVTSLEEAKAFAKLHGENKASLRIESFVAPAPSQIWIYDYEMNCWVEQVS